MSQPGSSSMVWSYFRAVLGAIAFVILVPVISGLALWLMATYYPEETADLMAPVLKPLVSSYERKESGIAADLSSRLAQVEKDLAELKTSVGEIAARAGETGTGGDQGALPVTLVPDVSTQKLLSALDALTVARVEYAMGNRGVALREVRLAQEVLRSASYLPEEVGTLIEKAASELAANSPAAGDWLSVVWHAIVSEVTGGGS